MAPYLLNFLIPFNAFAFYLWHYAIFLAMMNLSFPLGRFPPSQAVSFFHLIPFVLQTTCEVKMKYFFKKIIICAGFIFDPEN